MLMRAYQPTVEMEVRELLVDYVWKMKQDQRDVTALSLLVSPNDVTLSTALGGRVAESSSQTGMPTSMAGCDNVEKAAERLVSSLCMLVDKVPKKSTSAESSKQ